MSDIAALTEEVKELALETGFARASVAEATAAPGEDAYDAWLSRGNHAGMEYLERNRDKRFHPDQLVPGARSVLCLAVSYAPAEEEASEVFIARYARGRDYHDVLKQRGRTLMDRLKERYPDFSGRVFTDSAPLAERSLAAASGLGWIGRNGCLIVPGLGSYVVLCEIVSNLRLQPDAPLERDCGACRACMEACPTAALSEEGLNARKCFSYLSKRNEEIPSAYWPLWGNRIIGCDRCLEVCPQNRRISTGDEELLRLPAAQQEHGALYHLPLADYLQWTPDRWDAVTPGSAVRRADWECFVRNAILAAGNSGDPALIEPLHRLSAQRPQWGELIHWALEQLPRQDGN
jgi:epoxyqueuosine reductase